VLAGALWVAFSTYRNRGIVPLLTHLVIGLVGFLLPTFPVAILNYYRGLGEFSFLPFSGGLNLYIGNNPNPCETLTARPGWDWTSLTTLPYRKGIEQRSEHPAFFYKDVLAFLVTHPAAFLLNLLEKAGRFLTSREIPRNLDIYVFRPWSVSLRLLVWKVGGFGFPFGILLPLAAIGGLLQRRRIPPVFWLFLILYSVSVVLVFVADRYRVPIIPVMAILAAAGTLSFVEIAKGREWKRLILLAGVILGIALASSLPRPICEEMIDFESERDYLIGLSHAQQAQHSTNQEVAAGIEQRIRLYESGTTYRRDKQ